ncbi:SDR family oxidoreductase [Methanosphaerula palustris]|uniref:NAD-dependent epimerase/dehydratase n=1 Tax=Methanosphaerula palustris (strain ATCC BAA-1556 / DSM 19958 / E1-9c) TaxID=521011 RepID=B8GDS9_METPE|nr:SDR family oxidoreductase [Methanosphaerula palustris]ACL17430.1 NAD-dependent epimerase/dehydratase [Methanosphaerula palustris E1-9c]
MKVVVTGGAGFIGSNLAEELSKKHQVIVLDDLSTGREINLKGLDVEFIKGSITDLSLVNRVFSGVDYVFHEAALPSVQRSVENPVATNEVNIGGTLNVLMAARDQGVKKIMFASSSSVYGDTPTLPKRESMTPAPMSPYAVTKLTGEHYFNVFSSLYGLKMTCLRYFNVFGPRQDPKSQYAAVIPNFITKILNHESPIIHGDGEQTRDFTFIRDVVHANILAMESSSEGIFNIACDRRVSLNVLADQIMEIIGERRELIYDAPRSGDVRDSLADYTLAKEHLNYEPGFTLLQGLEETIQWFRNQ